ncbi:MAG: CTP synthase [Alphaproteobacteria bacterium]
MSKNTKYIFITGGVVSSLGKGLASASLASILQDKGFKVRLKKCDPYLNVDPGTMSPYQHGECFVTDDGTEADLDLGHYERFSGVPSTKFDSVTTGKIYMSVIEKERHGDYLGSTIQVVPHITNEIKSFIQSDIKDEDFVLIEIGGTVGDIEGQPYLEAIRQLAYDLGREKTMFLHLTLLPYIPTAGEMKTKPTQHSVKKLQEYGIQPNILLCRCQMDIPQNERRKLALFCNVPEDAVIMAKDTDSIYKVPLEYSKEGLDKAVCKYFNIKAEKRTSLNKWRKIVESATNPEGEVKIAVVGKYTALLEAYKSLHEAIIHGGIANKYKVKIKWINSEELESKDINAELADACGIIVPGGFGQRGAEGKIMAVKYARENKIPFLGICYGMQLSVIETLRNVAGIKDANTTENDKNCTPAIALLTEWEQNGKKQSRKEDGDLGGTMRLGAYDSVLVKDSNIYKAYKTQNISERHRHRYEVNANFEGMLENAGMKIVGWSPDGKLPEAVEVKDHPWFVGVQYHPELKSKPFAPAPLFVDFIKEAIKKERLI